MKTRTGVIAGAVAGAITALIPAALKLADAEASLRTARAHAIEAEIEAKAVEQAGWESFSNLMEAYEDQIDALKAELQACEEG